MAQRGAGDPDVCDQLLGERQPGFPGSDGGVSSAGSPDGQRIFRTFMAVSVPAGTGERIDGEIPGRKNR